MPRVSSATVHHRLKTAFKDSMPSGREIAGRVVAGMIAGHDPKWIKQNFGRLVEQVQHDVYRRYLKAERAAGMAAIRAVFTPLTTDTESPPHVVDIVAGQFHALDRFFLSVTQGRKQRAGGAFEYLIRELFVHLRYPFTAQAIINGQLDFVLPSEHYFHANPMDCIIFTVKRTLRERWRQIISEGTRGLGFFLATIDEKIAARDLPAMLESRIHIVVPARIKNCRDEYKAAANVITFEQFFSRHLDPAMKRWRASGVIS